MSKETLGELEHQVLLTTLRLERGAFSAAIVLELERRTGRDVSAAAVYIALRRLEKARMVTSSMRTVEGSGGARSRRYFSVTGTGIALLRESRRRFMNLWEGLDVVTDEG